MKVLGAGWDGHTLGDIGGLFAKQTQIACGPVGHKKALSDLFQAPVAFSKSVDLAGLLSTAVPATFCLSRRVKPGPFHLMGKHEASEHSISQKPEDILACGREWVRQLSCTKQHWERRPGQRKGLLPTQPHFPSQIGNATLGFHGSSLVSGGHEQGPTGWPPFRPQSQTLPVLCRNYTHVNSGVDTVFLPWVSPQDLCRAQPETLQEGKRRTGWEGERGKEWESLFGWHGPRVPHCNPDPELALPSFSPSLPTAMSQRVMREEQHLNSASSRGRRMQADCRLQASPSLLGRVQWADSHGSSNMALTPRCSWEQHPNFLWGQFLLLSILVFTWGSTHELRAQSWAVRDLTHAVSGHWE
jgi:hypothetical protein